MNNYLCDYFERNFPTFICNAQYILQNLGLSRCRMSGIKLTWISTKGQYRSIEIYVVPSLVSTLMEVPMVLMKSP